MLVKTIRILNIIPATRVAIPTRRAFLRFRVNKPTIPPTTIAKIIANQIVPTPLCLVHINVALASHSLILLSVMSREKIRIDFFIG